MGYSLWEGPTFLLDLKPPKRPQYYRGIQLIVVTIPEYPTNAHDVHAWLRWLSTTTPAPAPASVKPTIDPTVYIVSWERYQDLLVAAEVLQDHVNANAIANVFKPSRALVKQLIKA